MTALKKSGLKQFQNKGDDLMASLPKGYLEKV
jgi:hypothetical protein